jgi:hypothetical protein
MVDGTHGEADATRLLVCDTLDMAGASCLLVDGTRDVEDRTRDAEDVAANLEEFERESGGRTTRLGGAMR